MVSDDADGGHHDGASETQDHPVFRAGRRRWRWLGQLVRYQCELVAQLYDRKVTSEWSVSLRSFPWRLR
jgi:hypothetical protein